MSFADTLTLKNAANADVTFGRIGTVGGNVRYLDLASTLTEPRELYIGHQMATSPNGFDRHLLKMLVAKADASGKVYQEVWNFTRTSPRSGIITDTMSKDLLAFGTNLLKDASLFDKWKRGEM